VDFATPKWRASKSISVRLALPSRAGSRTAARNSLSLICVIVADLEFGCTVTQMRAMTDYIGHNAARINDSLNSSYYEGRVSAARTNI
jgi:hypothetical protein